jgi:hypothetical protein
MAKTIQVRESKYEEVTLYMGRLVFYGDNKKIVYNPSEFTGDDGKCGWFEKLAVPC